MDLHTVIDNLHHGKRVVNDKELKTIIDINQVAKNDNHIVGSYYSNLASISSILENNNNFNLKNINSEKKGFILTHQGILLLLEEQHVLKNITTLLRNSNSKTFSSTSKSIQKILSGIEVSELLQVQLSRNFDAYIQESSTHSFTIRLTFSLNSQSKTHIDFTHQILQIPSKKAHSKDELNSAIISLIAQFYSEENMMLRNSMGIDENNITLAIGVEVDENVIQGGFCLSSEFETNHHNIMSIYSKSHKVEPIFQNVSTFDTHEVYKDITVISKSHAGIISKELISTKKTEKLQKSGKPEKSLNSEPLTIEQIQKISKLAFYLEQYYSKKFKSLTHVYLYFSFISTQNSQNKELLQIENVVVKYPNTHSSHKISKQGTNVEDEINEQYKNYQFIEDNNNKNKNKLLGEGVGISNSIIHGNVKWVKNDEDAYAITSSDIVVMTSFKINWLEFIRKARGVICEQDDQNSILAQICYNYQIRAIINTKNLHHKLSNSQVVTIDTTKHAGLIYEGIKPHRVQEASNTRELINSSYRTKKQYYHIFQNLDANHILLKSYLPSQGLIIENIFDLIDRDDTITSREELLSSLTTQLCRIVISHQPFGVYINISSFSHLAFSILFSNAKAKEDTYQRLIKKDGIMKALDSEFETIMSLILQCVEHVKSTILHDTIELFTTNVQDDKSLKQLLSQVNKLTKKKIKHVGAICGVGGIVLIDNIKQHASFVACDMEQIKLSCGYHNIEAHEKLLRTFLASKSTNIPKGIYNISSEDVDLLSTITLEYVDFISCETTELLYQYSLRDKLIHNTKNISKKHKPGIKFKSNTNQ